MEDPNKKIKLNEVVNVIKELSEFENVPDEIFLKILSSYINNDLKDIYRLSLASSYFKKRFYDTGIIYHEIFRRQFGPKKFNDALELIEPYKISSLNQLLAYRYANSTFHIDHLLYIKFNEIKLKNNCNLIVKFSDSQFVFIISRIWNNTLLESFKNVESILTKNTPKIIKNLQFNFQKNNSLIIIGNYKYFGDISNITFIISAILFENIGFMGSDDELFLGCNYCGSQNISGKCGGCQKVNYCNKECQLNDYKEHQKECK